MIRESPIYVTSIYAFQFYVTTTTADQILISVTKNDAYMEEYVTHIEFISK